MSDNRRLPKALSALPLVVAGSAAGGAFANTIDSSSLDQQLVAAVGCQRPEVAGLDNPMQKSVWSLFDWMDERYLPATEASRHQFLVERPAGKPLIAYFFGDSVGRPDQRGWSRR